MSKKKFIEFLKVGLAIVFVSIFFYSSGKDQMYDEIYIGCKNKGHIERYTEDFNHSAIRCASYEGEANFVKSYRVIN